MRGRKLFFLFLVFCLWISTTHARDELSSLRLMSIEKTKWLNTTRPLNEEDFKGKAILLDFWTYGCVNCMQIVPDLEYLERTFGDKLLIVGVHSAKFDGESGNARILFAAKRFGLKHPVYNDSDFAIWNSYRVKAWPTQILLGPDGTEIARYTGEGHRAEIEKDIAALKTLSESAAPVAESETTSTLSFPARVEINGDFVYIADAGHNRIVVTDKTGRIVGRAGSGAKGFADGSLEQAEFNAPKGLAIDGDKIYVADTGNHRLRLIDMKAKTVVTLAGNGLRGRPGNLASPWDVELIGDDRLAIANAGTHQILSYDLKENKLAVLAGSGAEDIKDGPAQQAALAQTSGLSYSGGVLYFVDAESSALRQLKDGQVKTLIGTGLFDFGLKDGKYPEARLQHPQGLNVTRDRIFIADTYNDAIRVYDLKNGALSTCSLQGEKLNEPGDVFIVNDKAYVTDTNNSEIKSADVTACDGKNAGRLAAFKVTP